MAPAFHLLLPFRRRSRTSAIIAAFTVAGMLGWTYFLIDLDLPSEIELPVIGLLFLVFVGREAIPLIKPGISHSGGLAIDSAVLALSRDGETAQWRWDEISDIRLRSRFHPARLIYGRFLTFRAPKDNRRRIANSLTERVLALGRFVVIADDYPSRTDEIFRQIDHYRTHSTGGEAATRQPEPLWSFRKDRKEAKLWRLVFVVLGPFLGIVVAMALVGHLPETVEDFLESWFLIGFGIGFGVMLPWIILIQYRWEARQDNMIAVSAGGIATAQKMQRRLWLWRDILDMRVQHSTSRGEAGGAAQIISFRATHDGSEPGKEPKEGKPFVPVSCAIEDFYEKPVEEVARHASAWWNWSNETFGRPELAVAQTGSGEGKIAFRRMAAHAKGRGTPLDLFLSFVIVAPMLVWLGVLVWMIRAEVRPPEWMQLPDWLDSIDNFLIMIVPLAGYMALMAPGLNRLELDDAGLLSVCYARKRRWAWHQLGVADIRRVRSKWSAKQRAVLTIEAPANGVGSAILRWAFNIDDRRLAIIEDIYDSPLDEIAEAINKRWRRQGRRSS